METLIDDGIIIFSSVINKTTKYSALTEKKRDLIFTDKGAEESSANIIRTHPNEAKEIARFFESSFSGDIPRKINISHVGPEAKALLIETIACLVKKKEKAEK